MSCSIRAVFALCPNEGKRRQAASITSPSSCRARVGRIAQPVIEQAKLMMF